MAMKKVHKNSKLGGDTCQSEVLVQVVAGGVVHSQVASFLRAQDLSAISLLQVLERVDAETL